jgi:protein TonB
MITLPMIYFDALPKGTLTSFLVAPPPPPPPEAPKVVRVIPRQVDEGKLLAPKEAPKHVAVIVDSELDPLFTEITRAGRGRSNSPKEVSLAWWSTP